MATPEPTVNDGVKKNSKLIKGVGNTFYYGLALDSLGRSVERTKRLTTQTFRGMRGLLGSAFKSKSYSKATSIDDVIDTYNNCASTMVGTSLVILFYAFFTYKTSNNTYAIFVNAGITIAFIIYFAFNMYVYLACQQEIEKYKTKNEFKVTETKN